MYLGFYRLKEFPFSISCDERYFYESPVHNEALANMMYTVQQRKGMVLVTGEVGAGKTFVGSMLGNRLGANCTVALIKNPPQSGRQLLGALARRVGLETPNGADKLVLEESLEQHLTRLHCRGRLVAMILDECQDLTEGALEEIRLIWNWEFEGHRLVQVLLIGQPELRERIREPKWESLRQRIVLSYHLGQLSEEDTAGYIRHRLAIAANGEGGRAEFAPEAIAEIYQATGGIPRLINVLSDNALLVGYARGVCRIDLPIIREVLRDMTCWGLQTTPVRGQGGSER